MGQSASTVAGAQNRTKFRSSPVIYSMKETDDSDDVVDVFVVGEIDYSSNIPDECLACIFHFLSSGDRKSASLVCRRWLRVEGQSRHRLSLNAQSDLVVVVPSIFSRFDSVTKLALKCDRRSTSIGDEALVLISFRCRNLTRLKLRSCRELTDAGMEAFAKNCKGLKKLSCGSCAFGAKGMNAVLNNCSALEELSVKRLRGITDGAAAEAIGPGVAGGSLRVICLKELYNGQCFGPLIIGSKNLRTLKLFRCSGDWDKILEVIAEQVSELVEIHLERLQVSDTGLAAISKCSILEILHLVKTPECTNNGLKTVAENCKLLRKLHIDGWKTNRISDEGLIAVAKHCPNLQELVLIGVNPTCASLEKLAMNCLNLERLALCGSETVGDPELSCIAAKCVALRKLCIKSCPVSDQGMEALAGGCPNLVKVKVKKCRLVTSESADWLRTTRGSVAVNLDTPEPENPDASARSLSTSLSETSISRSIYRKPSILPTVVFDTFPSQTIKKSKKQINYVAYVQLHDVNRSQSSIRSTSYNVEGIGSTGSLDEEVKIDSSGMEASIKLPLPLFETQSSSNDAPTDNSASLSIVVIGATGLLSRTKIFPALFALYYSGQLPEKFCIFGYSRKKLTEEDLRAIIAPTLSCRIDHQENCEEKMDAFLKRTFYLYGGYDNQEGMSKLNTLMEEVEGKFGANRIFYLSVPQEAVIDVASSLAEKAQTQRGWNRVIIEKPFGLGSFSSHQLTTSLLSNFEEKQLYRIDHLLGRNTIENLAVLRFSNLVFMPLWNRSYIHNIQVTFSEESDMQTSARYPNGYGILGDVVHSHIFQTVALLAMEPPVTLDGEDVRYEKVKVLRSIRKLGSSDVILGHCKADSGSNFKDVDNLMPTYFGAVLYIDNARWDGVPFLIKAGRGLKKNRVEIRIEFRRVPGNLYHKDGGHMQDLATNELILRDVPDEAILVRINNKIPGLGMNLEASELNLLYKDKYNVDVTDSYEQLLHDVIDGDNHLFMRSDEVEAAWNILSPVLSELDNKNVTLEHYEFGSTGPDKAGNLWAKHGVKWLDE